MGGKSGWDRSGGKKAIMDRIVFWQRIVSPHMFSLASALKDEGYEVRYVAEELMSRQRSEMGWKSEKPEDVEVILIEDKAHIHRIIADVPSDTVHLVQGVFSNGIMESVRRALKSNGAKWGAIMETVDERSWKWPLKRLVYRSRLWRWAVRPDFVLAIGERTSDWVTARGFPKNLIFPMTYFIQLPSGEDGPRQVSKNRFRIGFIGRLIPLKRVELVVDALAGLSDYAFEFVIIGSGPLASTIEKLAVEKLGENGFSMRGMLSMDKTRAILTDLDCLVLPSDHDGWGAVVTEALMAGVPAICSDACGSSEAVKASGVGGVFPKGDVRALQNFLKQAMDKGPPTADERKRLAQWARCFGPEAGAAYITGILASVYEMGPRPNPPWQSVFPRLGGGIG